MTHNTETLIALRKSINHWKANAAAENRSEIETGPSACALCGLFNNTEAWCCGCPVMEATGHPFCRETPHLDAEAALDDDYEDLNSFRKAAKDEENFLRALVPAGADIPETRNE